MLDLVINSVKLQVDYFVLASFIRIQMFRNIFNAFVLQYLMLFDAIKFNLFNVKKNTFLLFSTMVNHIPKKHEQKYLNNIFDFTFENNGKQVKIATK